MDIIHKNQTVKVAKGILLATIVLSLLVAGLTLTVSLPRYWEGTWADFYGPFAVLSAGAVAALGASVLFVVSSQVYTAKLRQAYGFIAAGIVSGAIGSIQLPILNATSGWHSFWITYGVVGVPFLAECLLLYGGMRALGRLVNLNTPLLYFRYIVPAALVCAMVTALLPHVASKEASSIFASNAVASITVVFYTAGAIIGVQIMRHIGRHYTKAMLWLSLGVACAGVIAVGVVVNALLTGVINGNSPLLFALELVTPVVQLWAGYIFAGISVAEQDVRSGDIRHILDMITYAAALASDPTVIDPLLDNVRATTAKLGADRTLTAEDERRMMQLYLQIEQYLTSKEPLRHYHQEALRLQMTDTLRQRLVEVEGEHTLPVTSIDQAAQS